MDDFVDVESRTVASVEAMLAYGRDLAASVKPGTVIALSGDLGTGKTHLTKGIADGLGIPPERVRSPTFTILQTYPEGRLPLYHFDAYRVASPDEFYELGFEEYFYGDGVSVVEWPERVADLIPDDALRLTLSHVSASERRIERA